MNKLKYSIIYAVIRPEISERISVGLIFVDGDKVDIRYSNNLIAVSPLQSIDIEPTEQSKARLFQNYISAWNLFFVGFL